MDKTGTRDTWRAEVTEVVLLRQDPDRLVTSQPELLAVAAGIERRSGHPLAQAIVGYSLAQGVQPVELADFRSLAGAGASARLDGRTVYVGSPELFHSKLGISLEHAWDDINHLQSEGKTVAGRRAGTVGADRHPDNIRPNAAGDSGRILQESKNSHADWRVATAKAIAGELGIDEIYADMKPEDKAVKVLKHQRYGHVAMVGDVNDAPAWPKPR
jgi:Cd2+/Zn2+-exporting ATPase